MNQFRFNNFAATLVAGAGLAFLTLPVTMTTAEAQSTTKQCSTQYQAAKEAGTLNGQKWPQFLSQCSDSLKADNSDDVTPDEPVAAPKKTTASKPAKTQTASTQTSADGKPLSPAQIAFRARISECGDQWQQAKASNRTGGKTWPQYWSACNTRLKSE